MRRLISGLISLTWPSTCACCDTPSDAPGLCPSCTALAGPRDGPRCRICDRDLPLDAPTHRCGACLERPPRYERAWGLFDYAGPLGDALRAGKYGKHPGVVEAVGRLMVQHLPAALEADPPAAVLAIPLHRKRVQQRGFAPPLLLAWHLAKALNVPLLKRRLVRLRDTPKQAGLDRKARRANMRGAFGTRRTLPDNLLLIDDVCTTGATLDAATLTLRRAGVRRIRVLTAAQVARLSLRLAARM
jgi:predicted amidophosphoribosyltransferase